MRIEDSSVLITGGAGFLGPYIIRELLPHNPRRIYVLDNLTRGSAENLEAFARSGVVDLFEGDIRDRETVDKLMRRSDYCFHLAAIKIRRCVEDPNEAFDIMSRGTFDIVDSAHRNNVCKLIYSSSASVYGHAQRFPTPETDNPYDNRTLYGACKLYGEQLLRSYAYSCGLKYVALRYFNLYGPGMDTEGKYTDVLIKWLDCIEYGRRPVVFGSGRTSMDFVYVADVAKANLLALRSAAEDDVYNIGSGRETSLNELLRLLLAANGSDLEPEYLPEQGDNSVQRRLADISKAREELGYAVGVDLETGLRLLSEWYFRDRPRAANGRLAETAGAAP